MYAHVSEATRKQISEFIKESKKSLLPRSRWFHAQYFEVYLRVGGRHLEGGWKQMVTVSNVLVFPIYRKKGIYTELLNFLYSELVAGEFLFIENVLNEDHIPVYQRRRFTQAPYWPNDVCFYIERGDNPELPYVNFPLSKPWKLEYECSAS